MSRSDRGGNEGPGSAQMEEGSEEGYEGGREGGVRAQVGETQRKPLKLVSL